MHRHFRLSSYVLSSIAVVTALVGCGSDATEESTGPEPTEATVFEASKETKADLGIEKWGYEAGPNGDSAKYRGYGAKNQVIAEVSRSLDRSNDKQWKFKLTASGEAGTAKESIDFDFKSVAGSTDSEVYVTVTENTFAEGSGPAKVLARFKADGAIYVAADLKGPSSLLGSAGDGLVDRCQELTSKCNRLLIRDEIAADGQSSECGLLRTIGVPLLGGIIGAGAGALIGGVGAIPGAAVGVVSGSGTQAALCIDAQLGARRARADFQKCQADQSAAGCTVTR